MVSVIISLKVPSSGQEEKRWATTGRDRPIARCLHDSVLLGWQWRMVMVSAGLKLLLASALFWGGFGFWGSEDAIAGVLAERMAGFPEWHDKPLVARAKGDLFYPDWMAGNWQVTNALEERVAPFAPDLVRAC